MLFQEESGEWKISLIAGMVVCLIAAVGVILLSIFYQPVPAEPVTNTVTYVPYFVNSTETSQVVNNYYGYFEVEGNITGCKAYNLDSEKGVVLACKVN